MKKLSEKLSLPINRPLAEKFFWQKPPTTKGLFSLSTFYPFFQFLFPTSLHCLRPTNQIDASFLPPARYAFMAELIKFIFLVVLYFRSFLRVLSSFNSFDKSDLTILHPHMKIYTRRNFRFVRSHLFYILALCLRCAPETKSFT